MKKAVVFSAGAALVATSATLADVSGIVGQDTLRYYESDGATQTDFANAAYAVLDLYVDFSAPNTEGYTNEESVLLNMFGVNVFSFGFDGMFNQSDVAFATMGTWTPSLSIDIPGTSNPTIDSMVTIGGVPGATNGTSLDPGFGDGTPDTIYLPDIGWYASPDSGQGNVNEDLQVWIGRFVVTGDQARGGANFDFFGDIGYNYGANTGAYFNYDQGGNFTFVPTPGALALLGLSGLCLRRRRA